jgi:NMD protein affecting ribosome stability and mRNA decay
MPDKPRKRKARRCRKCGKKLNSYNRDTLCHACMPDAKERAEAFLALGCNGPRDAELEELLAIREAKRDDVYRAVEGRHRKR